MTPLAFPAASPPAGQATHGLLPAGEAVLNTFMKTFSATIEAQCLERAIDLPGWSHAGPEFERSVLWYPWTATFRKIYFKAKHRREACKQIDRAGLLVRDLSDGVKTRL